MTGFRAVLDEWEAQAACTEGERARNIDRANGGAIGRAAISEDGERILPLSHNCYLRVWNRNNGYRIDEFDHGNPAFPVPISSDDMKVGIGLQHEV